MRIQPMTPEERFRSSPDDELWACVVCGNPWLSRQMRFQDGLEDDRRCPNHFAPNGGEVARDLQRAQASEEAAAMTERYSAPPAFPGWFDETELPALVEFSDRPVILRRGGASVVLTIQGTNLALDDAITFGHAGITSAVSPALTPVTYDSDGNPQTPFVDILVLTVQASVAVPIGLYELAYDGNVYRDVFDVRD